MSIELSHLSRLLSLWGTAEFNPRLLDAVRRLDIESLPLQQALAQGSFVLDRPVNPMVLSVSEEPDHLLVRIGVFYTGVIAGCQCADDPSSDNETNEYCELQLCIDKQSGEVCVSRG